jgi:type III pantothenate kinase
MRDVMVEDLIAVADVGNARVKLGLFAGDGAGQLPEPAAVLPLAGEEPNLNQIDSWLARIVYGAAVLHWYIASVNRPAATRLIDWIRQHRPDDRITLLASGDLPLEVRVPRPDMVGIDRLVDAVAVNRLRRENRPAVIVDVGTAITVDLISADGAFLGGAILPGIEMSARALHTFTDLLPLVNMVEMDSPPPPLGTATLPAIQSGLFWGAVGAIRQLVERLTETQQRQEQSCDGPQVFLTGGASAAVAGLLGFEARHVPNLTLSGIALTAAMQSQQAS